MRDFIFDERLVEWLSDHRDSQLDWDEGNRSKNAKQHGVSRPEVEEVFRQGLAVAIGMQVHPHADENRAAVVCPTRKGRLLFVLFTFRHERIRVISSRDAAQWEIDFYEEKK